MKQRTKDKKNTAATALSANTAAPKPAAATNQKSAEKSAEESSLLYRLAYRMGMHQTKQLSRITFIKRTAATVLILFALGTVLFVWLPRAAYVGTAELAVIIVAILFVFGRVILSLILGVLGFEKASRRLRDKPKK